MLLRLLLVTLILHNSLIWGSAGTDKPALESIPIDDFVFPAFPDQANMGNISSLTPQIKDFEIPALPTTGTNARSMTQFSAMKNRTRVPEYRKKIDAQTKEEKSLSFPGMPYIEPFYDPVITEMKKNYNTYKGNPIPKNFSILARDSQRPIVEYFKNNFMSFAQYMQHALYDNTFGYYSSGNVVFLPKKGKIKRAPDFITFPVRMSPDFGAMIAYQAYAMWLSMKASNDIQPEEQFTIVEFGAGEGILARDVLDSIAANALQEQKRNVPTQWNAFLKHVAYIIGEKSPALQERQKKTAERHIASGKLVIKAADARNPQDFSKIPINGLIVSNELPDAFPVHKVWQMPDGTIKICISIPTMNKEVVRDILEKKHFEAIEKQDLEYKSKLKELLNNDFALASIFKKQNAEIDLNQIIMLSQREWLDLKHAAARDPLNNKLANLDFFVRFIEIYFDNAYFPETTAYIKRHQRFTDWLGTISSAYEYPIWYLNYAQEGFIGALATILNKGFVITIDYGSTSLVHSEQLTYPFVALRMFPRFQRTLLSQKEAYLLPGKYDMTTSINFTDICIVGMQHGLNTVFYGPQTTLDKTTIAITKHSLLTPFDLFNPNFATIMLDEQTRNSFFSDNSFKMIIQQKNNTRSYYRLLHPSENLFPVIK